MISDFSWRILPGPEIEITSYGGPGRSPAVPERIDGIPVTGIGPRAFAENGTLTEVVLPDSVRAVGNYAFYHCGALRRLSLSDGVEDYGDGAVRMCGALEEIGIRIGAGNYRLVKEIAGDTDVRMRLRLGMPDGEALLPLPGYYQEVREDTRARAIHQSIVGAGYTYRQCFSRQGIDFELYDGCFGRIAASDRLEAGMIAAARIRYPYRLSEEARREYLAFLEEASEILLPELIRRGNADGVETLVRAARVPKHVLDDGILVSAETGMPEISGLLMETVSRNYGSSGKMEVFSL